MLNLITSFFLSKKFSEMNEARNEELQSAYLKNLNNPNIEKLHIFIESPESLLAIKQLSGEMIRKVELIQIKKQPHYSDFFSYGNDNLKDQLCMVANSDIYLSELDTRLFNRLKMRNEVFSLTRYEYDGSSPLISKYSGSHDCFIYHAPLPRSVIKNTNFPQNVWGSENVVIYEMSLAGLTVLNPCYQIRTVHLHKSGLREEGRIRINKNGRSGGSKPVLL